MLVKKIKSLEKVGPSTKKEKIIKGVTDSILEDKYVFGDALPSVNELSNKLGYARETVVKAYGALKDRGIINSKHGKGFFVANNATDQKLTIALVLFGFQTFQQTFYNTLRKKLGDLYQIDIYFHHNNINMYESILNGIKAQYGLYVVAPIQTDDGAELLKDFPIDKLLIVDRFQHIADGVSHITQEFEGSLSNVFLSLEDRIRDFKKAIFFYREDRDYPIGIKIAFENFCNEKGIVYELHKEYDESVLEKDCVYFPVADSDLWSLVKDCKEEGWIVGEDVGILSHNDTMVKEIIDGGITTFSTDFNEMARRAADFIMNRKEIQEIIPSKLIRRKSL